ncbi:MAG: TIGR02757 family protein [Melioribacteraceae bacterium]|nr:TIGR02757 family protein [Melioribacteraceae bacterium]MDD3559200.1 TIGR02757 family protein [Melioribacteraceae bacterium]
MRKSDKNFGSLKRKLNYHYRYFDRTKISPDPLEFPHRFTTEADIEISAFLSSNFAYGSIRQIINSLEIAHNHMGKSPYDFIINSNERDFHNLSTKLNHRFYNPNDVKALMLALQRVYKEDRSLRRLFFLYYFETDTNIKYGLSRFSQNLLETALHFSEPSHGLKFMFPDPVKGSSCKRMNLFLRWMVRKDDLDFGFWKEIDTSKLIIPVDTHVAQICKQLKLTKRKIADWKMAEEITENLKLFDSKDPVKYDFAICHIGIRKMEF